MMNTTINTKVTYSAALSEVTAILSAMRDGNAYDPTINLSELIDKMDALKAQVDKRNTAERKPTKTQVANVALAERVVEVLRNTDEKMTITQIMDADPVLGELNNQKVSALVRGLGDRVVKTIEKRKSYFSLA
jgi:hypothetical protein